MSNVLKFTGNQRPPTAKPRIQCSCGCQLWIITQDSIMCNVCQEEGPLSMILETLDSDPVEPEVA